MILSNSKVFNFGQNFFNLATFSTKLWGGKQLFQIEFISLVLPPLYLLRSFLFKFYFSLDEFARNFEILHQDNAKDWKISNKHVFTTAVANIRNNWILKTQHNWELGFLKIRVTWQLRVTLDSICNSMFF